MEAQKGFVIKHAEWSAFVAQRWCDFTHVRRRSARRCSLSSKARRCSKLPALSGEHSMKLPRPAAILAIVVLGLGLSGCGYNTIPTLEEQAKAKWADVQNQYQRRADLIPNLVATVQGYAKQEKDVLTSVIEARAKATSVRVDASQLTDPEKVKQFQDRKSTRLNSSHA